MTVLFADVVGSTHLGSEEDPEEVRALMSRYYEAARAAVAEHDGTIEKFIGDAVMAVFGLPRAHGDDAARALATALALRDRIGSDDHLSRLQVKFGVATGEVVGSRDTARGEFLVTGDAVNVAARLQSTAEPGEIVATDRTAWDARAQFEFGPATQIEVRGRPQPVMVRTLIGPVGATRRQPNVRFVGRVDELDQLTLTARRTFRDRIPAVVSIVAPAGTGKTRLVEEFLATRLPELVANARIEIAQCLPYGGQLTYWPLRSVLYSLAGLNRDASGRSVLETIHAWLGDRRDAELLAATVGAENAASADPTELFSAWRAAFARAASEQALVIVFEDLHWSSDSLLDLVEFVMDPRAPVPILMIAIARPELIDRRPAWGGGRRNFVSVYLDPLPESDIAAMVGPLLESAAEEVVRQVVSRSEGNPFFAGELAQAALERGAEGLPDTVQATVLARIDLLEDDQRRLLQVASIFGRTFRPEGLAALDPGLDGRRPEMVDALISRDLIRRHDAEHLAFRHILIRDVAYSTLPRSERSRLHAAAGDWFESRAAGREEEIAEIVALHYREAVMSAGSRAPAGAELRGKAVRWLLRAADSAISAAATREAEAHLRAALEFVDDPGEAAEIWARLGEVLGLLPGAFEANQHAFDLARDPARRLSAIAGLLISGMRYARANFTAEQIAAAIAEGKSLLAEVHDPALEAKFLAAIGFQPNWAQAHGVEIPGETLREALDSAARAVDLGEELDDANLISTALDALDSCAMTMGDWDAVLAHALRRREFASRLSLHELMDADHMATWAYMSLGDPQAAERMNAESSARLKAGQAPEWRLSTLCWGIRIAFTLGHWTEAMESVDQAMALWRQLGSPLLGWVRVGFRPGLLVARGRRDRIRGEAMSDAFRSSLYELGTLAFAYDLSLVNEDLSALERAVTAAKPGAFGPLMIQDGLRQLLDVGHDCTRIVEKVSSRLGDVPVLVPQLLRARGAASNNSALLEEALRLSREYSDVPTTARLLVELGRMRDDVALVDEGRSQLIAMGDVLQLERYGLS